jgi:hypothetical protein
MQEQETEMGEERMQYEDIPMIILTLDVYDGLQANASMTMW